MILLAIIIWFGTGLLLAPLSYALDFAFFQRKYPTIAALHYHEDRRDSIWLAVYTVLCPIWLLIVLALTDFGYYGLKWK